MTKTPTKPISFSGIQPSGVPSLGNYLGALVPFLNFQNTHQAYFCVVDHHAITVRQNPADLHANTLNLAAWYLAAGLDAEKCTLFIQSHVPAHTELGWILSTFTQMGELERMTQYKDKAARHAENINAGLFTYPSLMAADILLYHTHHVPVGDDQKQHLELTRDVAVRFNNAVAPLFTVPEVVIPPAAARVKDLQNPSKKMSKSEPGPGTILLTEDPAAAAKKISRAVTDSLGEIQYDPAHQPGLANLLEIFAALENTTPQAAAAQFAGQQYGALKGAVAEVVAARLTALQTRHAELLNDKAELHSILQRGATQARGVADATLASVRQALGYVQF
jgi:tryptophanyl-tRNA synthetase